MSVVRGKELEAEDEAVMEEIDRIRRAEEG